MPHSPPAQMAFSQTPSVGQALPHAPQLPGSLSTSVHVPGSPQQVGRGASHAVVSPQRQAFPMQALAALLQSAAAQQTPATHAPPQQIPASPLVAVQPVRSGSFPVTWQVLLVVSQTTVLQATAGHAPQPTR